MKTAIKQGRLFAVQNVSKHKAANADYVCVWLEGPCGVEPYLFTTAQLEVAEARAYKNPEDIVPRKRWWRVW